MADDNRVDGLEEEYEADILTLADEEGVEHSFEVIDAGELDGVRYVAMVPYDEEPAARLEQDAEMLIMRISEEDGQEVLDIVEDEQELYRAGQMFMERLSEVYDIDIDALLDEMEEPEA